MKYSTERQKEQERAVPALILACCRGVIAEQQPRDSTDLRVKQHERKMCSFFAVSFRRYINIADWGCDVH